MSTIRLPSEFKSGVVRTPDADIFLVLLFYADTINLTIYLDTGFGKHLKKRVNISTIASSVGKEQRL